MVNKLLFLWRKKYRPLLLIAAIFGVLLIGFLDYIAWGFSLSVSNITLGEKLSITVLFLTGVTVFWYTRETFDLKTISNKELVELRKQTDFAKRPFLRLQLNHRWTVRELQGKIPDIPLSEAEEQASSATNIELVNNGRGLAKSIKFQEFVIEGENIGVRSVPVLSANSGSTKLSFYDLEDGSDILFNNMKVGVDIKATIFYKDIEGDEYKAVFQSNPLFNDEFEILFQDKVNIRSSG